MSNVNTFLLFNDGQATPVQVKIASNSATTVFDATTGQINMVELYVKDNAGATSTVTVDIFDGTNTFYLMDTSKVIWHGVAVTAWQAIEFGSRIIPKGSKLRVTSNDAAGKLDVMGTKVGQARTPR